jgi:hypothetical protein
VAFHYQIQAMANIPREAVAPVQWKRARLAIQPVMHEVLDGLDLVR